jgi:hypothetical protein
MRIAFFDHSYHQKTRTSDFFRREFLSNHVVDEWWDDQWRGGTRVDAREVMRGDYDLIVVWQVEQVAADLAAVHGSNIVFVPMWDSCVHFPDHYWRRPKGVRIVSFCHLLHEAPLVHLRA